MTKTRDVKINGASMAQIFSLEDPIDQKSMEFHLEDMKYKILTERGFTRGPFQLKVLDIARKNDVSIIYNGSDIPTYLGVRSKNLKALEEEFEKIRGILRKLDASILDQSIGIICTIDSNVFLEKKIIQYLKTVAPDITKNFNKIKKNNFVIGAFSLATNPLESKTGVGETIDIMPYYTDQRFATVRLTLYTNDIEKALEYLNNSEEYLSSISKVMKSD
jgi:hypothetical protein